MERFEHGGDLYAAGAMDSLVDFSASLNPFGMPEGVRRALVENVGSFELYPDPHCRALTGALAAHEGVDPDEVLVCAGATDAITRICQVARPARALVCDPCYSGYAQALEQAGATLVHHELREGDGFALTDAMLDAVTPDIDVVFLANPNNPTSLTADVTLIGRVAGAAGEHGALVVVDECFLAFTDGASAASLLKWFPNLVIVSAFTKSHALAGLRVGWMLCSDVEFVARCAAAGQPWAVSVPAQVAGLAVLEAGEGYLDETRAYVEQERAFLADGLATLGMGVVAGEANYLLFRGPEGLYDPLFERGVVIRRCDNFAGLGAGWFRVAVRTHGENERLLAACKEVLS